MKSKEILAREIAERHREEERQIKSLIGKPYKSNNPLEYGYRRSWRWIEETITGYEKLWHGGFNVFLSVLGSDGKLHEYVGPYSDTEFEGIKKRLIIR